MKPCESVPGIIFNHEELPEVIEALGKYIHDNRIMHTQHASAVYEELIQLRHPKYGHWGGAFVPADEALAVSWVLKGETDKVEPRPLMAPLGMLSMVHIAVPQGYERKRHFAERIEDTVRQSRSKQS